jgi:hypothetical protein
MKLLREPLIQFAVLGAAVFAVATFAERRAAGAPSQIVVTRDQVERLTADFTRFHRRPPSAEEQQGLVRDYLEEEVSYREALALGLDRDDPVIRNRLRQKVEFLFDDVGSLAEPTDQQLELYLQQHAETFRSAPRITFEQIYLDRHRRQDVTADAAALLAELNRGRVDAATRGDAFVLDDRFDAIALREVVALFGERFASAVEQAPLAAWQGPIQSSYGLHLVRVEARSPAAVPPLSEIRDAVRTEWANDARQQAKAKLYAGLLARYAVTVEDAPGTGS